MSDLVDADLLSDLRFRSTGSSGVDRLCGRALARIEALEAQHREDASAIAVLGADREVAMKASAAALREVDALKARIEALEAALREIETLFFTGMAGGIARAALNAALVTPPSP